MLTNTRGEAQRFQKKSNCYRHLRTNLGRGANDRRGAQASAQFPEKGLPEGFTLLLPERHPDPCCPRPFGCHDIQKVRISEIPAHAPLKTQLPEPRKPRETPLPPSSTAHATLGIPWVGPTRHQTLWPGALTIFPQEITTPQECLYAGFAVYSPEHSENKVGFMSVSIPGLLPARRQEA